MGDLLSRSAATGGHGDESLRARQDAVASFDDAPARRELLAAASHRAHAAVSHPPSGVDALHAPPVWRAPRRLLLGSPEHGRVLGLLASHSTDVLRDGHHHETPKQSRAQALQII
ncbi:hypothetical protein SEVIR_7G186425v4 [Setaria viridis]|uniref:Uncharacterized protein n=1 Tax=Setaria viridis TaxID=4556 RepID=A0A4U6TXK4_SETVI|nr:hypothetical protein SEVIR_7G186425v2 [Setaria viridis]